MARVYNFSAGPAVLPVPVLEEAAAEMLDYQGCGIGVMEMSHRSAEYTKIIEDAEQDLRDLMNIPDNYTVLFLQGGASQQFSAVPLNLAKTGKAAYIVSGSWSKKAYEEAQRLIPEAVCLGSSKDKNFSYIPNYENIEIPEDASYVYICENETIYGTHYTSLPETGDIPLVSDQSSCFLSQPVDVSKYGVIYAGVQKNVGPAGCVIVIIRNDLIPTEDLPGVPLMLQYKTQADAKSLYNTPPAYTIYICGKVFKYLKSIGGVEAMYEINKEKAAKLYAAIDESSLFNCTVEGDIRSLMNVPFVSGDEDLDKKFIAEAKERGIVQIKGHRSVGGLRASIYNAMPMEGVDALCAFIKEFDEANK